MKKRLTAIGLMLAFFTTGALAATSYQKTITVDYGVTLSINGSTPTLTDVNGNTVQPFTYNGTTYVPIRAVSDKLSANVEYDATTKTATVTRKTPGEIVAANRTFTDAAFIFAELNFVRGAAMGTITDEKINYAFSRYDKADGAVKSNGNLINSLMPFLPKDAAERLVSQQNDLVELFNLYDKVLAEFINSKGKDGKNTKVEELVKPAWEKYVDMAGGIVEYPSESFVLPTSR